jgi:uncharacterized protein involved in exopolysaccharide biosynthesis
MSAPQPSPDTEAEREIDLVELGRGLLRFWWVVVAGVVLGAIVGALYSASGGSTYEATARVAPGQAFNPSGSSAVLTYLTSQAAINEIATSEGALEQAASAAGVPVSKLRGQVTTSAVNQTTGTANTTGRGAVLVDITVQLNQKKKAEAVADAIAAYVQRATTSHYVRESLSIYDKRIANFNTRVKSLQQRITILNEALKQPHLSLDERLLLIIQLDQSQATLGQTIDSLSTAQQEQILAQDVEQTQVIQQAIASKSTARSHRSSIVVGAIIGFLIGMGLAAFLFFRSLRRQSG